MSCSCLDFNKTLHYVSPAHGGWGVIRIAALVPESYQLFVSPFACGRHGALGGELNGVKNQISYLYIDESDIVSGGYEDLIPQAIEELFQALEEKPKVLLLFVSCLDDLLGTDHEQLNKILTEKYPDVQFRSCHMNPINLDTEFPPGVTLQNNIYSLLEKRESKTKAINLIGNNAPINKECELYSIMNSCGYKVNHITDFTEITDFKSMSESKLNLVLSPVAKYASKVMEESLGIIPLLAYHTYDIDEIKKIYEMLSDLLKIDIGMKNYESETRKIIQKTVSIVGAYPIAIDYQAVRKPFTLAKSLLTYGFEVGLIMVDEVKPFDKEPYNYIIENYKNIKIVNAVHHNMTVHKNKENKYLCIGFGCGYATNSKHVVNLMEDETLFGFHGVKELMRMLSEAKSVEIDLQEMIGEAKLII